MKTATFLTVTLGLILGLSSAFTAPVFAQDSALDQLKRAAGGQEHTGKTFDGSPADQKRGGIDTFVTPSTSSGTAGGYEVGGSSTTKSGNSSSDKNSNSGKSNEKKK